MDIRLTLHHGPVEVEIEGGPDDDYQEEFLEVVEFLEEHEERLLEFQQVPAEGPRNSDRKQTAVTEDWDSSSEQPTSTAATSEEGPTAPEAEKHESDRITDFANRVNVDPDQLIDFIDIDLAGEELPSLVTVSDERGDNRQERQFSGAMILLATWQECYGEERMKSSNLKDALEFSGIDSDQLTSMYHNIDEADSYFDRRGRGSTATVALTRPGKREAYNEIRRLVE